MAIGERCTENLVYHSTKSPCQVSTPVTTTYHRSSGTLVPKTAPAGRQRPHLIVPRAAPQFNTEKYHLTGWGCRRRESYYSVVLGGDDIRIEVREDGRLHVDFEGNEARDGDATRGRALLAKAKYVERRVGIWLPEPARPRNIQRRFHKTK